MGQKGRPVAPLGAHTSPRRINRRRLWRFLTFQMRQLLEAGVHFGHQAHRWNPKMGSYIFGTRNNIHIIDLAQSVPMLHRALQAVSDTVAKGGRILFVGTKRQAQDAIAAAAKQSAQYYVNSRWLGGTLTNWKTISGSISRLRKLDEMLNSGDAGGYTKKERLTMQRERDKLDRSLGGIKDMGGVPDLLVRDRHQQGRHRHQGSAPAQHSGRRHRRHQFRSGRHHLRRARQRRRQPRGLALLRSGGQGRDRRHFARARRDAASTSARRKSRSWSRCRRRRRSPISASSSCPGRAASPTTSRSCPAFRRRSRSSSTTSASSTTRRSPSFQPNRRA